MDDQLMKTLKNLGVISLSAHFIKDLKQVPHKDNGIDRKLSGPDTIPEKALKGKSLSHQAGYFFLHDMQRLKLTSIQLWYGAQCALCKLRVPYSLRVCQSKEVAIRCVQLQISLNRYVDSP
jgi:hypothetical protein